MRLAHQTLCPGVTQCVEVARSLARRTVQAGALRGARYDKSAFPEPEPYVLVFARDNVEGIEAFLFRDHDVSVSDLSETDHTVRWGAGCGCLFFADAGQPSSTGMA